MYLTIQTKKALFISIIIIPILIHFFLVIKFSVNIPNLDDYNAILDFLFQYKRSDIYNKLKLLLSQHNEHRIFFSRFTTLIYYNVFGQINFKHLIVIGNTSLIGIFLVLFKSTKKNTNDLFVFLPVTYFLFDLQIWENSFWAMASLQNFFVLLLSFLSIYLVQKGSKFTYFVSILFAIISTFTSGNGMFVFIIGLLILILQKRTYFELATWFLSAIITILFYFHNYLKPLQHPQIIEPLLSHPDKSFSFFFAFIGSAINLSDKYGFLIAILSGWLLITLFIYLFITKYYSKNTTLFFFILFLLITAGAATLTRSGFGIESAFTSRYRFNSILIIIIIYLAFYELFKDKHKSYYVLLFLFISIYFNILSYDRYIDTIKYHGRTLKYSIACFNERNEYSNLPYPDQDFAKKVLHESEDDNYYRSDIYYRDLEVHYRKFILPSPSERIQYNFSVTELSDVFIINNGWAYIKKIPATGSQISVVLYSESDTCIYETRAIPRPDVTAAYNEQDYNNSGFTFILPKKYLNAGIYNVGLYITSGDSLKIFSSTNKIIEQKSSSSFSNIQVPKPTNNIIYQIDNIDDKGCSLYMRGWSHLKSSGSDSSKIYIILQSSKKTYAFAAITENRPDVTNTYPALSNLDNSGFIKFISKEGLEAGDYKIGLLILRKEKARSFTLINKSTSIQ